MIDKTEVSAFVKEVQQWVGNSPGKAIAFGLACAAAGWLLNIWPL
ncbi:MAG: hypothetical protein V3U60_11325 [Gammaproteobacteria bacterium]